MPNAQHIKYLFLYKTLYCCSSFLSNVDISESWTTKQKNNRQLKMNIDEGENYQLKSTYFFSPCTCLLHQQLLTVVVIMIIIAVEMQGKKKRESLSSKISSDHTALRSANITIYAHNGHLANCLFHFEFLACFS